MPKLKFSISLPVFNSARYLEGCLSSIFSQDYPRDLIEVLVVDGGSNDRTLDIARKYNVKIFDNPKRLGEYGMQIAVRNATGDLLILFAADNGLAGSDWLKKTSALFERHPELSCLWGRLIAARQDPCIMRYYELIQSEPLAYFLNRNLELYLRSAERERSNSLEWKIFRVAAQRPLCWGANGIVYRLRDVKGFFFKDCYIGDNEIFQYMVESGRNLVAYSGDLNIYHHTVDSIGHWVSKWKRNYTQIFLKTRHQRRIDWFYCGNFKLKMFLWLVYSLVPIFSITDSLVRALKSRNTHWLHHPLMSFLQTCTYIYWTLVLPEGRRSLAEHIFA